MRRKRRNPVELLVNREEQRLIKYIERLTDDLFPHDDGDDVSAHLMWGRSRHPHYPGALFVNVEDTPWMEHNAEGTFQWDIFLLVCEATGWLAEAYTYDVITFEPQR